MQGKLSVTYNNDSNNYDCYDKKRVMMILMKMMAIVNVR